MHPSTTTAPDPGGAGTATDWTSWQLHVASRARSVHDRVVIDVVTPVIDSLGDRPWFFLRYWQGGPHVRLRVGDLRADERSAVERDLARRLAVAGELRDGEEPLDPEAYRGGAARLATTERTGGVDELRAPGVHTVPYVPEVERYGGPEFMPATERLFRLSSELAAALLPHAPTTQHRSMLAVRATVSAAAALGGPEVAARFYREALGVWRGYVAASGVDEERIATLCAVTHSGAAPDPHAHGPFAAWHGALAALSAALHEAGQVPGHVVLSHVHMFCNRIGRTIVDDMQTYAWLAGAGPSSSTERGE